MRQHIFAALVFTLPAAADDLSQCPAPIQPGPWGGQVTQSVANIFAKNDGFSGVLTGPVAVSEDFADFKGDACEPGFIAEARGPDGRLFSYEMDFKGWSIEPFDNMIPRPQRSGESDAAYRERLAVKPMRTYPIYEAEWKGHTQMTIFLRMVFLNTDSGVSQSDMRFTSGTAIGRAQPLVAMRAMQPSKIRYECRCRAKLDAWLEEKIAEAKLWQRAYGMKAWRKRPPGWPDKDTNGNQAWNANAYNALVIEAVEAHVANGVSLEAGYEAALPRIRNRAAEGVFTGGVSQNKTGGADDVSEMVAETNSECQILTYASHTRECFPNLSMESTLRHERQHRATCRKRGNAGPISAEDLGADEVLAYGAEIDFLTGWADRNCSN